MDHDHAAGIDPICDRGLGILRCRIGDVDGFVVAASRIAPIEEIEPFRRLLVAFLPLVTNGVTAERDRIFADRLATVEELQEPPFLVDDDPIRNVGRRSRDGAGQHRHDHDRRNPHFAPPRRVTIITSHQKNKAAAWLQPPCL